VSPASDTQRQRSALAAIILAAEDSADTIRPRPEVAGGDSTRVHVARGLAGVGGRAADST
jgi:hypothetical protein